MSEPSTRSILESRRLLREILNRRDFLVAAGGLAIGAGLAACGGGDSPGSPGDPTGPGDPNPPGGPSDPGTPSTPKIPDGLHAIQGTVVLPSGSSLVLADLSVDVATQTNAVSSTGTFTIGTATTGPTLALLLDKNGDGVLMSVFDPAAASYAISSRTSAVALLFHAVSGYMFPADAQAQILALLDADPAVAALEAVVAQEVAADPLAISNGAAAITSAISQALDAMLGTSSSTISAAPAVAAATGAPALMTVTPTGEQDGVLVSQDATTTSLLISNVKRRPCRVYIYKMGTTASNTAPVDPNVPAALVHGPFDLASTENLGLFSALKDFTTLFHGTSPWSPVNLAPVLLELDPGVDRQAFEVIVLASSWNWVALDAFEPHFFREVPFAGEVAAWRTDTRNLFLATVFGDMLFPAVCFLLGVGTIKALACGHCPGHRRRRDNQGSDVQRHHGPAGVRQPRTAARGPGRHRPRRVHE